MRIRHLFLAAAGFGGLLLGGAAVEANSIEIVVGTPVVTPIVGGYAWVYSLDLTNNNRIVSSAPDSTSSVNSVGGSTGSVVNFDGLGGVFGTPVFTATAANEGSWTESMPSSPPTIIGHSSGSSVTGTQFGTDVLFTYNGPTLDNASGANIILGTVTIDSTIGTPGGLIEYQARDVEDGSIRTSQINTDSPMGPAAVPLPATTSTGLSLFAGLGALVGLRKLTSRRSVA